MHRDAVSSVTNIEQTSQVQLVDEGFAEEILDFVLPCKNLVSIVHCD
jgi:hypothetical protein